MTHHTTAPRSAAPGHPAARLSLIDPLAKAGPSAAYGLWQHVRETARQMAEREPLLCSMLDELICAPDTAAEMIAAVLARRLGTRDLREPALRMLFKDILGAHPAIVGQIAADLSAMAVRDPACPSSLHALLNLKGFHALQTYRMAHVLWHAGRTELAFSLSSHVAAAFSVDIHPAARIGAGIMLDHASGIVIGETAVVDDDVSILQNVTLGGTGKEHGERHPKIGSGVMIGAGATILGNIHIGSMSKIAAGSVVLTEVPPHCTVAGIPARIVRMHQRESYPAFDMDQML
jgi:serine O-acetyltransferase